MAADERANSHPREIAFEDAREQSGHTQIPNWILCDPGLSRDARLTWAMLAKFAWQSEECWPGMAKLAELLGVTDRSVRDYIKELKDAGLVSVKRQGLGKPNLYRLRKHPKTSA